MRFSMTLVSRIAMPAFVIACLAIMVLSELPGQDMPAVGLWDKAQHFGAYFALGVLGALACWRPGGGRALPLLIFLTLLGIGLEVGQEFSPGRSPDPRDALANALGASAGILAMRAILLPLCFAGVERARGWRSRS